MKAKERHHLKENELAHSINAARAFIEPRTKQIGVGIFVLVLIAAATIGIVVIQQRSQGEAHDALAEAMVILDAPIIPKAAEDPNAPPPAAMAGTGQFATEEERFQAALPKLKAAADTYPDTTPGITARYHYAGALAALGKHKEAAEAYDEVIKRGGNSLYARMARLGKAEKQARAGQYDAAIATYKELVERKDGDLPADAILMQLAKTYAAAGKKDDAQKTFTKIVEEHPQSPYASEAREELEALKS